MDWLGPVMQGDLVDWRVAFISILLAFALTQAISAVYVFTFRGLSYSRSLVQGMALSSIVTCMLMLAISNSIAAAIGIAGGLSIIRFRTTMRDPRDMMFVFASLGAGIATGLQSYAAAIAGTSVFVVAAIALNWTSYGARRHFDGLIRFVAPMDEGTEEALSRVLRTHCRSFVLVTLRQAAQGTQMEHAYQISIQSAEERNHLVMGLQEISGVQDVTLLMQEPTLDL
jgi:uncharacterized membrane protein YhiD involved in acid resistance